jgi:hypothetical protein
MEFQGIIKSMTLVNLFVFFIVFVIGVINGFDLKKRSTWLYGIWGFLSAFLLGFLFADMGAGLLFGVVTAFMVIYTGTMISWHRRRAKDAVGPWLTKAEQNENLSFLARLIKKISQK